MADNNDLTPEQIEQREKALELQRQAVGAVKTPEELETERIAAEAAAQTVAAEEAAKAAADAEALAIESKKKEDEAAEAAKKTTVDPSTLSNEELLALVSERAGVKIESFDSFKPQLTEEDKKKEQEQREANRVAYGLQKGRYNNADFQEYINDLKDPSGIVFEQYKAEALADDPELDEEEIADEFKAKYGLDSEENTRKWKRGQAELNLLADGLIRQRHKKILEANSEFDGMEAQAASDKEHSAKISKAIPAYNADLAEVMGKVGKRVFTAKDGEKYEIEIDPQIISSLQQKVSDPKFAAQQIAGGYTKETLQGLVELAAVADSLDSIVANAIEQALLRKEAGLRGIPPNELIRQKEGKEPEMNEAQKKAIQRMKEALPQPQTN